jgi:hypothetical protein
MSRQVLDTLGRTLDERAAKLTTYDNYYRGEVSLGSFVAPEVAQALAGRIKSVSVNVVRLAVEALVERLRLVGVQRAGKPDAQLWSLLQANDLDLVASLATREALLYGAGYAIVWTRAGRPLLSVESAAQVAVKRDPATRQIVSALKRWNDPPAPSGVPGQAHAITYEPDVITRYATNAPGAPTSAWTVVETLRNPLGTPPVVELANTTRVGKPGHSEVDDLLPLADLYSKLLLDLAIASEFYSRPRRFVTGVEVPEDDDGNAVNPFDQTASRTWIAEPADAKIGQLQASDLSSYETGVNVVLRAIASAACLPPSYVGLTVDNLSADAVRAAEGGLVARAEARQRLFAPAWARAARLLVAVRDGVDPASVDVSVQWADPATRSQAQEADAVTKLFTSGIIGRSTALRRLGYSDSEIATIRTEARGDALDASGTDLSSLLP